MSTFFRPVQGNSWFRSSVDPLRSATRDHRQGRHRTLAKAEMGYSQPDFEGLAIVFTVTKFHKMIFGRKLHLWPDFRIAERHSGVHSEPFTALGADIAVIRFFHRVRANGKIWER